MPNFANNLKGNNENMTLDELDLDDEGLGEEIAEVNKFDEDTHEKPWLDNNQVNQTYTEPELTPAPNTEDVDVVSALLQDRGINPDSIKFRNEEGEIEEVKFADLSREEQLELLKLDETDSDFGLADDELTLINELRTNNISIDDYIGYQKRMAVEEYLATQNEDVPSYEVDTIPDDELYIIDLKAKVPELTDDDAAAELQLAKQNESLYAKKVQGIRNEYKQREDSLQAQAELEAQEEAQKAAQLFENEIVTAIQENDTIDLGDSSLTLSEDDMNEIASFILDEDTTGVRHIAKALNDPKTLVNMVWYALKGQEAISQISEYYKQKISEASKNNYAKGFEDAKAGKPATKTVVRKPATKPNNQPRTLNIHDLD